MKQPPTIAKDGKIECPNCGAKWFDWHLQHLLDAVKKWGRR